MKLLEQCISFLVRIKLKDLVFFFPFRFVIMSTNRNSEEFVDEKALNENEGAHEETVGETVSETRTEVNGSTCGIVLAVWTIHLSSFLIPIS